MTHNYTKKHGELRDRLDGYQPEVEHQADPPEVEHQADPPEVEHQVDTPEVEHQVDTPEVEQQADSLKVRQWVEIDPRELAALQISEVMRSQANMLQAMRAPKAQY